MKTIGWIKIYRKITEWGWFYDGNMLKALLWIICHANTVDGEYRGMQVRRGSLVTSRNELARCLSGKRKCEKVSEQQVRTILKRLQKSGEIIVSASNAWTVITVCKYDTYQSEVTLFDNAEGNHPVIQDTASGDIALFDAITVKKRYNEMFEGKLPKCERLSNGIRADINLCVKEYGQQTVDTVFENLMKSPFLTGAAPSGWKPDLKWIFQPDHYQRLLSGYYSYQTPKLPVPVTVEKTELRMPTKLEIIQKNKEKEEKEHERLVKMAKYVAENGKDTYAYQALKNAKDIGLLAKYKIDISKYNIIFT